MNATNTPSVVQKQYADSSNLSTRISIHHKYSVNKQGFGNWIADHYRIEKGMRILELGCGTGSMWRGQEDLIGLCGELVLSDLSPGMLETARANVSGPNVRHMVIDIQDIPFPDGSFDIVIANMMLYHVPDLERGLSEVRRVLKDRGIFYCATYGEHGILEYLSGLLAEYGAEDRTNKNFTLQNGSRQLELLFRDVQRLDYPDALAVTDLEDMVDFIDSLSSMTALSSVPRQTLTDTLSRHTEGGVLTVPKEYGMFIAQGHAVPEITLQEPTLELLLEYYKDFAYDPDIFMDMSRFGTYRYDPAQVAARFAAMQKDPDRRDFLILRGRAPIGEISLKHIDWDKRECELSIHLQNDSLKGNGYGTRAERLMLQYAFDVLHMEAVRADAVLKNKRSQHVLEKVGFGLVRQEGIFRSYLLTREKYKAITAPT